VNTLYSQLVTVEQLSLILNINASTIEKLAKTKQLPGKLIKRRYHFDVDSVLRYFRTLEGGAA
jgi:hypothetical protein